MSTWFNTGPAFIIAAAVVLSGCHEELGIEPDDSTVGLRSEISRAQASTPRLFDRTELGAVKLVFTFRH